MQSKTLKPHMAFVLLAGVVLAGGSPGCANHSSEQQQAAKIGASMQKSGIMSQQDYVHVRALGHDVAQSHQISDTDLDWTLAFLKGTHDPIAHAKAMAVLLEIQPVSPAQRAKIQPAITPLLTSGNALDRKYAQSVQDRMR